MPFNDDDLNEVFFVLFVAIAAGLSLLWLLVFVFAK